MEFDKSRIYTAVNADELAIGSTCIFADTIQALRQKVQGGFSAGDCAKDYFRHLVKIYDDDSVERFVADDDDTHIYAYLIEPPAEPKYKPFASVEEAMKAIKAHGGWIKYNVSASYSLVIEYGSGSIYANAKCIYMQDLLDDYVFADDGSPCGVPVEE